MTSAPKRRWFRFSLGTLFVMVSVLSIVICFTVRSFWLESQARLHDQTADDAADYFYFRLPINQLDQMGEAANKQRVVGYSAVPRWDRAMAVKYRRAIWRPWWFQIAPDGPQPPDPEPHLPRKKYPPTGTPC